MTTQNIKMYVHKFVYFIAVNELSISYKLLFQNMTFEKLNAGLEDGCNCLNQEDISENTKDIFVRAIPEEELSIDDWNSYYDIGKIPNRNLNCVATCKWRGVSINKLFNNEKDIKSKWLSIPRFFSPKGIKHAFICKFKLKEGAGKVWDTSNKLAHAHHDLLKSDDFCLDSVEVIKIIPFSEF